MHDTNDQGRNYVHDESVGEVSWGDMANSHKSTNIAPKLILFASKQINDRIEQRLKIPANQHGRAIYQADRPLVLALVTASCQVAVDSTSVTFDAIWHEL